MKNKKKNYHHGDLKPALIQAGLELLEEQGLEALTLRAIAARVGVSHTAPKNHFDGLLGLLAAIAAEGFRRHATEMRKGVEAHSNRVDRLRAATEGYVRFARENPALFKLMFSPRLKGLGDPDLIAAGSESYGVLRGIADGLEWDRPGPARGPGEEALRTETMLWAFAHGYASLLLEGHGPAQSDGAPMLDVLDVMPVFHYRD
ncbi:TetR-like C-terminal domain-containing protein [Thalassobaculum sp.]|uniref:TetR-like C-terminal domain-containing protein n=1 Tax=Thalassobaculum sp. TaxID=2022740 RepID=UPI003B5AFE4E